MKSLLVTLPPKTALNTSSAGTSGSSMLSPSRQPMASLPWVTSIWSVNSRGALSMAFMRTSVPMSASSSPRGRPVRASASASETASKPSEPQ